MLPSLPPSSPAPVPRPVAGPKGARPQLPPPPPAQVRREMAAGTGDSPSAVLPLPDFNGNVITPGTAFMDGLSAHLRAFLARKVAEDPAWRHMLVRVGGR